MNREEYLENAYLRLAALVADPSVRNQLSQVRARALQAELLPEPPRVGFTFDSEQVWNFCDYLFSESALLLREAFGEKQRLSDWIREAAGAFEFLASFADEEHQEILLLNSALCYHVAGYQANARCLARALKERVLRDGTGNPESEPADAAFTSWFRRAAVEFLEMDIAKVGAITSQALESLRTAQQPLVDAVEAGGAAETELFGLVAHGHFQRGLSRFARYCLNGELEELSHAEEDVQKSHEHFQRARDATLGCIASEIRTVLASFRERSTWSTVGTHAPLLLSDPVWSSYLRNLALDDVVEFWASQVLAISSGVVTSDAGCVIQMPTSAGKTLIAELCILAALTSSDDARCLYVAPFRALAREVEMQLARRLGGVGYRVSNVIGHFEMDPFQDFLLKESDVLVATPEKIDLLLRAHPAYFDNVRLVVLDEGHIVEEGVPSLEQLGPARTADLELQEGGLGRGALLELLMTRLKLRLSNVRFVVMSAVMPDVSAADFVDWLCAGVGQRVRIDPSRRPSRQLVAKFEWASPRNGELEYVGLDRLPDGRWPFVPYFVQRKQYYTGRLTAGGQRERRSWPSTSNKAQTTAMVAARFATTGPVLVFCAQRNQVRTVMKNLTATLKYLEASDELPHVSLGV